VFHLPHVAAEACGVVRDEKLTVEVVSVIRPAMGIARALQQIADEPSEIIAELLAAPA
jgi:hypothetical protein